jgi:ABC-2 type transport system permease protein
MTDLRHTGYVTATHLRQLWRQPWWIAVTLVQPVIWLLLFGSLFEVVSDLPGFGRDSYVEYLAPGIVVMTAFFSAGWSGMPVIEDLDRGVTDRLLVSPVSRGALIAGRIAQNSVTIAIQSLIIIGISLLAGATFPNGMGGVAATIGVAVLIGVCFSALSIGLGLRTRKEETLIATVTFLQLPLSFMSSTFMAPALMPDWMREVAHLNPLEWAVAAARSAALGDGGWDVFATRCGLLAGFALVCAWFAMRALESYQRSL